MKTREEIINEVDEAYEALRIAVEAKRAAFLAAWAKDDEAKAAKAAHTAAEGRLLHSLRQK